MLARRNRLTTAAEFKRTVRSGRRFPSESLVTHIAPRLDDPLGESRFGFIVGKKAGVAVVRNRVRRRLRAACYSLLPGIAQGHDVVIRALPPASAQPFAVLYEEVSRSLAKGSVLR